MNKVVARFSDGRMVKGMTSDFFPGRDSFKVSVTGAGLVQIQTKDLKALFFVKNFAGDQQRVERKEFDPSRPPAGRRISVAFKDGEVLVGTTQGYQPDAAGLIS